MSFVWLIPSVAMGLVIGITSGYWQLAVMAVAMTVLLLLVRRSQVRKQLGEGKQQVFLSPAGVAIGNRKLPGMNFFWSRAWDNAVLEEFERFHATHQLEKVLDRQKHRGFAAPNQTGRFSEAPTLWLGLSGAEDVTLTLSWQSPHLLLLGAMWLGFHVVVLWLVGRLIRAPLFYFAVGSQSHIGGPASAPGSPWAKTSVRSRRSSSRTWSEPCASSIRKRSSVPR